MAVITVGIMKTLYDFLDDETIGMAMEEVEYLKSSAVWRTSSNVWPKSLTDGAITGTVSQAFCGEELSKRAIELITPYIPKCNNISVQHYLWHPLSGINMHNDSGAIFGATIYLTPEWNINWGGLFVYEDAEVGELRINFPYFNSININTRKIRHMVTTVSPLTPYPRHTLQIWGE